MTLSGILLLCCGSRNLVARQMLWRTWERITPGIAERTQLNPLTRGEGQVGFALFVSSLSFPSTNLSRPPKMSAVRRSDRRAARSQLSSPYKRPNAQPKKSVRAHFNTLHALNHLTSAVVLVFVSLFQLFKPPPSHKAIRRTEGRPF